MTMEHDLRQAALLEAKQALESLERGWSTCPLRPLYTVHASQEMDEWWMKRYAERADWVRSQARAALSAIEAVQEKGEKGNLVHPSSFDLPAASGSDVPARPTSPADVLDVDLPERVIDQLVHDSGFSYVEPEEQDVYDLAMHIKREVLARLPRGTRVEQGAPRFLWCCERGCGVCAVKRVEFEYERTETLTGELVSSKTIPRLVSACCGADVSMWDDERGEQIDVAIEPMPRPAPPVADPGQAGKGETK